MQEGTQHLLKFLPLRDLPISECETYFKPFFSQFINTLNANTHICAKNTEAPGAGTCTGDSGGLLMFFLTFHLN
jgi:hypothetical protein